MMGNVLQFPIAVSGRHDLAKPTCARRKTAPKAAGVPTAMSLEREARIDRMAELLADRAKRRIAEWQAKEGMPDEETMLIARLESLSGRPEGLNNWTLYRLDALLKLAGWGDDDA